MNESHDNSIDRDELLARLSRELDRFPILLAQIEAATSRLMGESTLELPQDLKRCLQSIDYLSQASVAISATLDGIQHTNDENFSDVLETMTPTDLRERLLDRGLDDIDNTTSQVTFF